MLPFDNKSELQVIVDAPNGTALEETARLAAELGDALRTVPEVTDFQTYIGISAPFNFNGLVRHYYLRRGANLADIQVNLVGKGERSDQSHDIAKRIRPVLKKIADRYGARIKVAEIPPGPPVLSTLVAEVYGPDQKTRLAIARQIKEILTKTPGVVDVDWYVEDDQPRYTFAVDREKAALSGVSTDDVVKTLRTRSGGMDAGTPAPARRRRNRLPSMCAFPLPRRSSIEALSSISVPSPDGSVPLSQLVRVSRDLENKSIYRKNLKNPCM